MNQKTWFSIAALLLAYILVASTFMAVSPIGEAEAQNLSREERNWELVNHNERGTNHNPQNQINKQNAHALELKWVSPIPSVNQLGAGSWGTTEGSMAPQLIVDGMVFNVLNRNQL